MRIVVVYTPPLGLRFRRNKARIVRADIPKADPKMPHVLAEYRQAVSEQQSTQERDIAGIRVGSGAPRLQEQLPVPEADLAAFQRDLDALDWLRVRVIIPPHEAWWAAERVVKELLERTAEGTPAEPHGRSQ